MNLPPRIALVGFMGAGKSTVGRRLAIRIGYHFIDSDAEVESRAGTTVSEIFRTQGERHFRELEREAIRDVLEGTRVILATGGGAFAETVSADLILRCAFTIHLNCDFGVALGRVAGGNDRPLVTKGEISVRELFAERKDRYSRAHATVDTSHRSPDEVASDILVLLSSPPPVYPCAT